jgi:Mg-chelatase subunit ChlD
MRAHRYLILALGLLALGARAAEADREGPAFQAPSAIHAVLDGTQARLVVRFAHRVAGPDRSVLVLTKPTGAVITGASVTVAGQAHRLALVHADAGAAAFDAIRKAPAGAARGWAALIKETTTMTSVALLAPRNAVVALEVEMMVPTCFYNDARYAALPDSWSTALDATLRARTIPDAAKAACLDRDASDTDDESPRWIRLASTGLASQPPGEPRIGTIAGRLPLAMLTSATHLARVELDLAGTLTAVPPDLATAIVIDGSRSVDGDDLEAERRVVASYLRHAPSSRVQVITYARAAHAMLPAWSLATRAAPQIDRELRALVTRNGSNLEAGIAEAGTWLKRVAGTRRMILFTDERLADAVAKIPASQLVALLPGLTLVHVIAIDGQADSLQRGDTAFAELASATEGIAVRGGIRADGMGDAALLARPISLDHVTTDAPGWTTDPSGTCSSDPTSEVALGEGRGCTWWWTGTAAAGPITIAGQLWGHRITRIVRPDPDQAVALARERQPALGLDPKIGEQILDAAHAVNARWSLFTTWKGHDGYSDIAEGGGTGVGAVCGCGRPGTFGHGSGTGTRAPGISTSALATQLRDGMRACHVDDDRVEVRVETTLQEIVGLDVKVSGAKDLAAKRECAEAALWSVQLALPDAPRHATTTVVIGARTP